MKLIRLAFSLLLLCPLAVALNRLAIPSHHTSATHFDTLLVLGYPANPDGTPSPEQRERVLEAVREYKAGVAPAIIMTGGPAHNQFVEAHVMATLAEREGVPASAIVEEPQAQNTIQNIYYSSEIMHAHNWRSAEVISSPAHLGRAAMILQATAKAHPGRAIDWRTHPSLWPAEYSLLHRLSLDILEATRCLEIRIFGFPKSAFLP
jgi:uncharacterized SAM-binding protein YcdF (DUF218 family)